MPMTCTGSPSADASRRLSPVMRAQEKSRAMFSTALRPGAQERVLHLAHDGVEAVGDDRHQDRIEAHVVGASARRVSAACRCGLRRDVQQVVAEMGRPWRSSRGRPRRSSVGSRMIGRASDLRVRRQHRAVVARRLQRAVVAEERGARALQRFAHAACAGWRPRAWR